MFLRPKSHVEDFEAVALPHLADIYRSASFLVQNQSDAEDLVQEVYLEGWKSFHRFQPGTNCRAWLFRIMFNRLHHLRRRLAKTSRTAPLGSAGEEDSVTAETPVPAEIRDEDVLSALSKLPVEYREVVLMADVEEFSYKEVAEALKIPLGTVMSRLSRGRKLLREGLAGVARQFGIAKESRGQGESA